MMMVRFARALVAYRLARDLDGFDGYIGRFFEPFSLENVSPQAAHLLNLPLEPTLAQFDLKPERDTQLELGGHLPLGLATWGFESGRKTRTISSTTPRSARRSCTRTSTTCWAGYRKRRSPTPNR
jgi:hypothetical protein